MAYIAEYRPKIFLSTHLPFIGEGKKNEYIKVLKELWGVYPGIAVPDFEELNLTFPSYLLQ